MSNKHNFRRFFFKAFGNSDGHFGKGKSDLSIHNLISETGKTEKSEESRDEKTKYSLVCCIEFLSTGFLNEPTKVLLFQRLSTELVQEICELTILRREKKQETKETTREHKQRSKSNTPFVSTSSS